MPVDKMIPIATEQLSLVSGYLQRSVLFDCFVPEQVSGPGELSLLLINDGQNMAELGLAGMLEELLATDRISPLVCVAVHAGKDRKMEYGTARQPDYLGRGARAGAYAKFIMQELLPFVRTRFNITSFRDKSFAGFSLGGLSAMDIAWNHPTEFKNVGVFSGSLWWRTKSLEDGYNENTDRIMHSEVREGGYYPWMKFFFETGTLDETMDRNGNGIIDSIDDTTSLIDELMAKGYRREKDIRYLELSDGRHDIATWARAMPVFLEWGWQNGKI
jgi:enterochelin esterase-like enzyme